MIVIPPGTRIELRPVENGLRAAFDAAVRAEYLEQIEVLETSMWAQPVRHHAGAEVLSIGHLERFAARPSLRIVGTE